MPDATGGFDMGSLIQSGISAVGSWFGQQSANETNVRLAQENRDWSTQMSNTAHQREVADLKAAGLNPILSANRSGAGTPVVSSAQVQSPSSHAVSSALEAWRTGSENAKRDAERRKVEQDMRIKKPVETGAGMVDAGLGAINAGASAAGEGAAAVVHALQNVDLAPAGRAIASAAEAASVSTAAAAERIRDVATEYGVRISDVISNPGKFVGGVASSAASAVRPYTIARELPESLKESIHGKRGDKGNASRGKLRVEPEVDTSRNPKSGFFSNPYYHR